MVFSLSIKLELYVDHSSLSNMSLNHGKHISPSMSNPLLSIQLLDILFFFFGMVVGEHWKRGILGGVSVTPNHVGYMMA